MTQRGRVTSPRSQADTDIPSPWAQQPGSESVLFPTDHTLECPELLGFADLTDVTPSGGPVTQAGSS